MTLVCAIFFLSLGYLSFSICHCVSLLVHFSLCIPPCVFFCVFLILYFSLCISPCVSVLLNFSCVRLSSQRRGPRTIISSRRDPTTNYTMRTTLISAKCVADTKEKKSGVIFDICQKILKQKFCPFSPAYFHVWNMMKLVQVEHQLEGSNENFRYMGVDRMSVFVHFPNMRETLC